MSQSPKSLKKKRKFFSLSKRNLQRNKNQSQNMKKTNNRFMINSCNPRKQNSIFPILERILSTNIPQLYPQLNLNNRFIKKKRKKKNMILLMIKMKEPNDFELKKIKFWSKNNKNLNRNGTNLSQRKKMKEKTEKTSSKKAWKI